VTKINSTAFTTATSKSAISENMSSPNAIFINYPTLQTCKNNGRKIERLQNHTKLEFYYNSIILK